tara:strand:+ start:57306 stop:57413 length:108 start_codon:yes stop_codon:yes gene_type:complete
MQVTCRKQKAKKATADKKQKFDQKKRAYCNNMRAF